MKKKKNMTLNLNFEECRKCIYFPDISVESHPYYIDEYGVKHRNIKYICQYDNHEINTRTNRCPRNNCETE